MRGFCSYARALPELRIRPLLPRKTPARPKDRTQQGWRERHGKRCQCAATIRSHNAAN